MTDGDIVLTTTMFSGIEQNEKMITYQKNKPDKVIVNESILINADISAFGSKIGWLTNLSTTLYTLKDIYPEYKELIENRLKMCVAYQSQQIDSSKNGTKSFILPNWWAKFNKTKDIQDENYLAQAKINNIILLDKRPYFMRYVYSATNSEYVRALEKYENYTLSKFGKMPNELSDENEDEAKTIRYYQRVIKLIDSNFGMNAVCHYMENATKHIKIKGNSTKFDWANIFVGIPVNFKKLEQIKKIFKEYAKSARNEEKAGIIEIAKVQLSCVSSNIKELLYFCFLVDVSKTMQILGQEFIDYLLIENKNTVIYRDRSILL